MAVGKVNTVVTIGSRTFSAQTSLTADCDIGFHSALSAGNAGELTTRTSDSEGTVTMDSADHGVSSSAVVDVFWTGGVRYGMTVGTVSGTSVPLTSSGAGDNLPAGSTELVVTPVTTINMDFDGDDMSLIAAQCDQRTHLNFKDSGGSSLEAVELTASEVWEWHTGSDDANPLTGNAVDTIDVSNGTVTASTLDIAVLYDSTS